MMTQIVGKIVNSYAIAGIVLHSFSFHEVLQFMTIKSGILGKTQNNTQFFYHAVYYTSKQ